MIRSLITLVTCPFCPRGWELSVDLTALRVVVGRVDQVYLPTTRHPAVVFGGVGSPCRHLAALALFVGWEEFRWRGDSRPGGCIEADWSHSAGSEVWRRVIQRPPRGDSHSGGW